MLLKNFRVYGVGVLCVLLLFSAEAFAEKLEYQLIGEGPQQGITNQQFLVINNDREWADLLSRTSLLGKVGRPDLINNTLLAVLTDNINCAEKTFVKSVVEDGGIVTVNVVKVAPKRPIYCAAIMLWDGFYQLVEIPKTVKPVSINYEIQNI